MALLYLDAAIIKQAGTISNQKPDIGIAIAPIIEVIKRFQPIDFGNEILLEFAQKHSCAKIIINAVNVINQKASSRAKSGANGFGAMLLKNPSRTISDSGSP